jgi:folate-binding protein YgfZ
MTDLTALPTFSSLGACALPHLGVMRATGPDAASFLHNQLTQDFLLLDAGHARLAAFCNAKGRMQASMVGLKTGPEDVLLVMRQDLLAQTLKRLSMFVLRAKVKLSDVSAELGVWGVFENATDPPWTCRAMEASGAIGATANNSAAPAQAWSLTLYPASGVSRSLQLWPLGFAPKLPALALEDWLLGEVLSGIADVQAACFEAFVPQMLNYESVDGVNFKKGCYPGQEVVARSQFRGTLKRRAYLVSSSLPVQAGQEVFDGVSPVTSPAEGEPAVNTSQPVGQVAQAAHHSVHGDWALVCLQTSAADAAQQAGADGVLHVGAAGGAVLSLHPLPYALRDDI